MADGATSWSSFDLSSKWSVKINFTVREKFRRGPSFSLCVTYSADVTWLSINNSSYQLTCHCWHVKRTVDFLFFSPPIREQRLLQRKYTLFKQLNTLLHNYSSFTVKAINNGWLRRRWDRSHARAADNRRQRSFNSFYPSKHYDLN